MPRRSTDQDNINIIIGRKIRAQRIISGLSRDKLAKKINVTHQQVFKYENGTNCVGPERMQLIAKAFNKPIQFFFDDSVPFFESTRTRLSMEMNKEFQKIKNPSLQDTLVMLMRIFNRAND